MNFIDLHKNFINNFWKDIKINQIIKLNDNQKIELYNLFKSSPFLSEQLSTKLKEIIDLSIIRKYTFSLDLQTGGNVQFHFVSNKSKNFIYNLSKFYFFVIYLRINLNNKYRQFNFMPHIYINIIPVPISKKFIKNIGINEINSASTYVNNGNIYIWRKDELDKVLIHETLHSIHYDLDIINQNLIPELSNFQLNHCNKLNINEAYTELCAIFLYNLCKNNTKKIFRSNLLEDAENSFINCAKLLKINNIEKIDNLYLVNYNQEAAAFSYIILRTGLLWLMLFKCKNKLQKHTDKLKCLEEFLILGFCGKIGESYQHILLDLLRSKEFANEINKRIKKIDKKIDKKMILAI